MKIYQIIWSIEVKAMSVAFILRETEHIDIMLILKKF